jgi:uncharacterized membrane protein YgcG
MAGSGSTPMHPFYGPNARLLSDPATARTGMLTMAAYLVFWAGAVAVGLRMLGRRFPAAQAPSPVADTAVATLRERYAKGDIGREEYLAILADLRDGGDRGGGRGGGGGGGGGR